MSASFGAVSEEVSSWFSGAVASADKAFFPTDAATDSNRITAWRMLQKHGSSVVKSDATSRELYGDLMFTMIALCRIAGSRPELSHWQGAIKNVRDLKLQIATAQLQGFGLAPESPAKTFKGAMDDMLRTIGVGQGYPRVDGDLLTKSVGLAINWGMRLLLANALERGWDGSMDTQELKTPVKAAAWLREKLNSLES